MEWEGLLGDKCEREFVDILTDDFEQNRDMKLKLVP